MMELLYYAKNTIAAVFYFPVTIGGQGFPVAY